MRTATVTPITDRTAADDSRPRPGQPCKRSLLLDALIYAGALFDPSVAMGAHRFELLRERECREGRW